MLSADLPADLLAVPFSALALVIVSLLTQKKAPPQPLLDAEGRPLSYENRLGI